MEGRPKLRLDFGGAGSVCRGMPRAIEFDQDTRELVVQLLTRAGTIMEDASVLAVRTPVARPQLLNTICQLAEASSAIGTLIAAAEVLARRE